MANIILVTNVAQFHNNYCSPVSIWLYKQQNTAHYFMVNQGGYACYMLKVNKSKLNGSSAAQQYPVENDEKYVKYKINLFNINIEEEFLKVIFALLVFIYFLLFYFVVILLYFNSYLHILQHPNLSNKILVK